MGVTAILALVFLAILSVLLILIVLVQNEDGDGLGGLFGGSASNAFGPRAGNILTKITTVLAVLFFLITILFAFVVGPSINKKANMDASANVEASQEVLLENGKEANTWSAYEDAINNQDADEELIVPEDNSAN